MAEDIEAYIRELTNRQIAGNEAKATLDKLEPAFKAAEQFLVDQARQAKPLDKEAHTEIVRRLQTLDAVRSYFVTTLETGKAATQELEFQKKSLAKRAAEFMGVSRL